MTKRGMLIWMLSWICCIVGMIAWMNDYRDIMMASLLGAQLFNVILIFSK